MTVVGGGDAFVDGTQYDVLKADGGIRAGTAFAAIDLPAPTPLLSFDAQQLRDRVRIIADVQSYTTVAKNAGQRALAQQLDRIVPLSSGELRRTLGAMQRLNSEVEFGAAFDSLDPSVHARHSQASLSGPRKHARTLHDRMTALRIATLAAPEGAPAALALAGGDAASAGQGMWKTSFTLQGGQGERHDVDGLTLGFDRRIGENLTAGVSFAHAANEVQPDSGRIGLDRDQSSIRSGLAAVYGSYFDRRWHLSGTLATGRNDYESRRSIVVGPLALPAASSHRGTVTATSMETGYLVPAGQGWLDPYLNLQHTQVAEQGFSEAGSGAAGLVIAARRTRELLSTLGVRWSQIFERGNGAFVTPEIGVGWLHDFSRAPSIRASYVGAPAAGFTIEGAPVQREGAVLGLGLNYRTQRGMTGSIRYSGELRRGETSHGVVGEFRVEF
jgi:outer membrane autotransporter protein